MTKLLLERLNEGYLVTIDDTWWRAAKTDKAAVARVALTWLHYLPSTIDAVEGVLKAERVMRPEEE